MATRRFGNVTRVGTSRCVIVPSPNSPAKLSPQQYTSLFVVTPHVCPKNGTFGPALTIANVCPPATGGGDDMICGGSVSELQIKVQSPTARCAAKCDAASVTVTRAYRGEGQPPGDRCRPELIGSRPVAVLPRLGFVEAARFGTTAREVLSAAARALVT